jgi:hypothetical protein
MYGTSAPLDVDAVFHAYKITSRAAAAMLTTPRKSAMPFAHLQQRTASQST